MAMPHSSSYRLSSMVKAAPSSYTHSPQARNVTSIIHSPERNPMLCRYPSKLCDMLRSEKRGGGLHRFCAYHRERANINQRRVDHRRRLRKQGLPVPPIERAPSHWQHSDEQHKDLHIVKSEPESEPLDHDDDMKAEEVDLFDVNDEASPLLADFSSTDLQELLQLLDDVDTSPGFSIKDEPTRDDGVDSSSALV